MCGGLVCRILYRAPWWYFPACSLQPPAIFNNLNLERVAWQFKKIQTSLNNSYHTILLMSLTDSTLSKGWNVECRVALKLNSPRDCLSAHFTRRSFGRSLIHRPRALRAQTFLPGPREAGSKHYVMSIHLIWLT